MKKLILLILLTIIVGNALVQAQCDKKVLLSSSQTQYLDSSLTVQRTVDEHTVIEITSSGITISPGNHTMTGTISSQKCDWKIPFKEGKTVIKASLTENNDTREVTFTISGKDGKITFLAEMEEDPSKKILLVADSFEENK